LPFYVRNPFAPRNNNARATLLPNSVDAVKKSFVRAKLGGVLFSRCNKPHISM